MAARSPRYLTAFIALASLTLTLVAAPGGAAPRPRQADPTPGAGQGIAELVRVDPAIANLALTIRVGTSLAGHQNLGANSEARSVDLGFIGSILAGEACDGGDPTLPPGVLPEILSANSADPDHAGGISDDFLGLVEVGASASDAPKSAAHATLAPLGLPGLVEVTGGRTSVTSTADGHRTVARSEIGRLEIAGGLVVIEGMRWEAIRQLEPAESSASFTAGKLLLSGFEVPLPLDNVLPTIQKAVAPILGPLGIELSFPQIVDVPDGVAVTPLSVGLVPGELRDSLLAPIFEGVQPAKASLSDFLIDLDCGNATYVTVLDVVLGAISGAGFTSVRLGGVQADAKPVELTSFLGGPTDPPPPPPPSLDDPTTGVPTTGSSGSGTVATPTTTAAPPPTTLPAEPASDEQAIGPIMVPGSRGGALLAIGGLGLVLAGIAAFRDRYLMRKAQQSVPMDIS